LQVRTKYLNKKTVVDGITFDSKKEAQYYQRLKLMQMAGEIKRFELQPKFELLPSFKYQGKAIRAITYKADFRVIYPDGREEIIDCKAVRTQQYIIRKKLLLAKYPEINFREV
jgi:hypothetical protein